MSRFPVITVTDLYHPPEDPGDNFDLVMPYGLPEVDLRAVILDAWNGKRHLVEGGVPGYPGPRDPGIVPVAQLNAVFGARVPSGICPFTRMRTEDDPMLDVPDVQQTGIDLLIETLRSAPEPVEVMSFGSARPIAVAFNRAPEVLREKIARVHLSAGTAIETDQVRTVGEGRVEGVGEHAGEEPFMEWNVYLDPLAVRRVLTSGLQVALYPCASWDSCYAYDPHNTFYWLHSLGWIADMHPLLRRYLGFALGRASRPDFLRALEEEAPPQVMAEIYARRHAVWETAAWLQASGRVLVRRPGGECRIVPGEQVTAADAVVPGELRPCRVQVLDSGLYTVEFAEDGPATIFEREDPLAYEDAMNEALPALYRSFEPTGMPVTWRAGEGG